MTEFIYVEELSGNSEMAEQLNSIIRGQKNIHERITKLENEM